MRYDNESKLIEFLDSKITIIAQLGSQTICANKFYGSQFATQSVKSLLLNVHKSSSNSATLEYFPDFDSPKSERSRSLTFSTSISNGKCRLNEAGSLSFTTDVR